ncbi:MAG: PAS domain S-box protein, partial [Proteobacteria bacterium]|nr:PAS domain S-box protein [Pseudomonadota bacterium]
MNTNKARNLLVADKLRMKAEKQLQVKTAKLPVPRTNEEILRVVHELEVYQIELELQNAELRQARDEREKTLDKYTDLFDFAPIGYFTLGRNGSISTVNLAGASLLGIERSQLLGRRFGLFVADKVRPLFSDFLEVVFARQGKESCEVKLAGEGHSLLFAQIEAVAFKSGQECRIAVIDITERKRAEEALSQSEQQFRTLADAIPHMCWMANADGGIFWYNQRWYEYTGTTPDQM